MPSSASEYASTGRPPDHPRSRGRGRARGRIVHRRVGPSSADKNRRRPHRQASRRAGRRRSTAVRRSPRACLATGDGIQSRGPQPPPFPRQRPPDPSTLCCREHDQNLHAVHRTVRLCMPSPASSRPPFDSSVGHENIWGTFAFEPRRLVMESRRPAAIEALARPKFTESKRPDARPRGVLPFGVSISRRDPAGGRGSRSARSHEVAGGRGGERSTARRAAACSPPGFMARVSGQILWCVTRADLFAPGRSTRAGLDPDRVIYVEAGDEKTELALLRGGTAPRRPGRRGRGGGPAVDAGPRAVSSSPRKPRARSGSPCAGGDARPRPPTSASQPQP